MNFESLHQKINKSNLYMILVKNTNNSDAKIGDDGTTSEPESFWLKKKKVLEKLNRRARRSCRRAVKSQAMFWLIIMLVFLNTCVLVRLYFFNLCNRFTIKCLLKFQLCYIHFRQQSIINSQHGWMSFKR